MPPKSFQVRIDNNQLVRTGRPKFSETTTNKLPVQKGQQDRRHILHGATQISDVLIDSFNRVLATKGRPGLEEVLDRLIGSRKLRIKTDSRLEIKICKIITLAFGSIRNQVVGSSIANQGIEKVRTSVGKILSELETYCSGDIFSFEKIKEKTMELLVKTLRTSKAGMVARYRRELLTWLKESIENITDTVSLIRLLHDFKFSCTLDIIHDGTTKERNIWGITMANKLQKAIAEHDEDVIHQILLTP